jgi:3-deoxy-D-manno-octulosonic-acid transferase
MWLYSAVLAVGLVLSAPWWLLRMVTIHPSKPKAARWEPRFSERYREGLGERLGRVPRALLGVVTGKRVVWVHAVSVGEVLAATRLVAELEERLGVGWVVVVSTTTKTGQSLAKERFGAERVFYYPLDFAWAVRAYLRAVKPAAVVLMESEVWPRMLWECRRGGVPVVVANARVSDRSFARGMRVRGVWGRVLRGVGLWLAQSEEDGKRLVAMGASEGSVKVVGNLKFDIEPRTTPATTILSAFLKRRILVVAGSLLDPEESILLELWDSIFKQFPSALLLLAPRHPERFASVIAMARVGGRSVYPVSDMPRRLKDHPKNLHLDNRSVIVLDTIGDLASVYRLANVAFVGGSLIQRGGHNPLEPAQFGVPVVMGPSFENFRDIVAKMQAVEGIAILGQTASLSVAAQERASGQVDSSLPDELEAELVRLLTDREAAKAMGERGRKVFEEQQGATGRAVVAIVGLIAEGVKA